MARAKLYPDDQSVYTRPKISGRRGSLIWKPWRGLLVVQHAPRYTPPSSLAAIRPWIMWLKIANILWLYTHAKIRNEFLRQEKISGIPARDLFMSAARGHMWSFVIPGGKEFFSMATMERYSRSLDVFGQSLGDILVRGPEYWVSLPVGADGSVLTVVDGTPQWAVGGAGAGGVEVYVADSLYPWSTTRSLLFTHVYAVRLPYSTEGAAALTVPCFVGGKYRPPSSVVVNYVSPSGAVGTAIHYTDFWACLAEGEPLPLGRTEAPWSNTVATPKFFSSSFLCPPLPDGTLYLSLRAGRTGSDSRDTMGDYTYISSIEVVR